MLEAENTAAFQKFTQLCENHGLLSKPRGLGPEDVCDGFSDEATLLRFFHARACSPEAAFQQFKESFNTRQLVDDVATYENIEVEDYESTRKLYPHWSGQRDSRGLPICMFDIAYLDSTAMAGYNKTRNVTPRLEHASEARIAEPNSVQRALAFHDTLTRFILPLCTSMRDRPNPESPILSAVYLVDISAFGIKQAWDLRSYAQDISKLLATSFPEVVDTVFVLNAPSYFGKTWNFLKKWIDPRTAEKLVVLRHGEVLPTLTSSMELANIPIQFGGQFSFQHGAVPKLDSGICRTLQWMTQPVPALPTGPIKWIADQQGRRTAVAVGRVDGEPRHQVIASLNN